MKLALPLLIAGAAMCGAPAHATETIAPSEQIPAIDFGTSQKETELKVVTAQAAGVLEDGAIPTVPEPATWGMLILGMLGVGFAMRRPGSDTSVRIRYL